MKSKGKAGEVARQEMQEVEISLCMVSTGPEAGALKLHLALIGTLSQAESDRGYAGFSG